MSAVPEDDSKQAVPSHVAIIMDGNGRWAKQHARPRALGHKKGAEALRALLRPCAELGIKCLSVYAFSHENWQRPSDEVNDLMGLLKHYLSHEIPNLMKHGIKLHVSGDVSRLPDATHTKLDEALSATKHNETLTLNICLSYSARQELVQAYKQLMRDGVAPDAIDEAAITSRLYTAELPELDLLIRTGGDIRLSNFLLWQSAYTELYFTDILWPEFDAEALAAACNAFATRERRYGRR